MYLLGLNKMGKVDVEMIFEDLKRYYRNELMILEIEGFFWIW